jgi:hypothetical protein
LKCRSVQLPLQRQMLVQTEYMGLMFKERYHRGVGEEGASQFGAIQCNVQVAQAGSHRFWIYRALVENRPEL